MHALNLPLEIKSIADTGHFVGHAAVFGNVDLGGDVIERGAFKEFRTPTPIVWQHDLRQPIGVAQVAEDAKGLRVLGDLVLEDPVARVAYAHMKAGSARAMSFGYDVLPGGAKTLPSGVRQLSALRLHEVSVVTLGMNPDARIDQVKERPDNIRAFERALRDLGYSQKQATAIALHGFSRATVDADEPTNPEDLAALKEALQSLSQSLKG